MPCKTKNQLKSVNSLKRFGEVQEDGSSPRMWGTPCDPNLTAAHTRFIPTHVGNTLLSPYAYLAQAVHPHACGEHPRAADVLTVAFGSSPRMWGTRLKNQELCNESRFIPTHVGNTLPCYWRATSRTVHPHACGEHDCGHCSLLAANGSSPRMWGTHFSIGISALKLRFIPTHVGNTPTAPTAPTVHPHACGEHYATTSRKEVLNGSSPRMWGTLKSSALPAMFSRFIPTHVGNTFAVSAKSHKAPVHPHACGEHPMQSP